MCCLVKIYGGKANNQGSKGFNFTAKDYKKVHGAFCSGGSLLSLTFGNGRKVMLRNFEQRKGVECPPNKRPMIFSEEIKMEVVSGVITEMVKSEPASDVSVYLIMEK